MIEIMVEKDLEIPEWVTKSEEVTDERVKDEVE